MARKHFRKKLEDDPPDICPILYGGALGSGTHPEDLKPNAFRCMGSDCYLWHRSRGCSLKTQSSDPAAVMIFILIAGIWLIDLAF